jgi:hypothetical protein
VNAVSRDTMKEIPGVSRVYTPGVAPGIKFSCATAIRGVCSLDPIPPMAIGEPGPAFMVVLVRVNVVEMPMHPSAYTRILLSGVSPNKLKLDGVGNVTST